MTLDTMVDVGVAALARQSDAVGTAPLQLLDENGRLTAAGQQADIDLDLAQDLYAEMLLARRLDHEALALQRQGSLHLWLMSWGQEAAQVGSIRALRSSDMVFPSYREHAAALSRGISPADVMRQWSGVAHSGWDTYAHRFHIYSLVLGTQTLHATGYAAGVKLDRSDEIVLTYFGDGAASQGDVNVALNWAATGALPVLFFCQNNQWAISTPTSAQTRTPLHVRAAGFGVAGFHVDGNDALAVHAVTALAAQRVRAGEGPALVEAQTYRLGGHSSSDDPKRYRDEAELATWQARDPLRRLEVFLRDAGVPGSLFDDLTARSDLFAAQVRRECAELHGDDLGSVFGETYAEPHPVMEDERRTFRERSARSRGAVG